MKQVYLSTYYMSTDCAMFKFMSNLIETGLLFIEINKNDIIYQ